MKILIVLGVFERGGIERIVSHFSQEWAKSHQVTIVLFEAHKPVYPFGGKIHYLKTPASRNLAMKIWRSVQRVIRLASLIRKGGFTHQIGFMEFNNIPLIVAACLTGTLSRTTASVHLDVNHIVWYQRHLLRVLYRLPKRIIAVSHGIKQELVAMGIPEAKIDFIPNPAPAVPASHAIGDTAQACVAHLPRPSFKGKYILAVGRLVRQKGFDLLLHAYAGLATTAPPLVILGEGELRGDLTRLAKQLDIGDRVHFMGVVDNPEYYYTHTELFVLSSRWEGWPLVIPEAMAYGCPVVSFDCPTGPREIIAHNKNGVLVENGNVNALTKGMAQLLGDAKLRQRLGKAGQARAKEFDVAKIASRWLEK